MNKGPVIILVVVGLVAGYFIGNVTGGSTPDEGAETETADLSEQVTQLETDVRAAKTGRREAESALRDAQRREMEAVSRAETAETALATAEAAAEAAAVSADAGGERAQSFPVFEPTALGAEALEALADTKWDKVGGHMAAMVPALVGLGASTVAGTPMDPATMQIVQENNMPLAGTAIRLTGAGVPGIGPNGAFTHPAFMVNAMAAALEAAELPLSDKQNERFATLGDDFVGRYARQLEGHGEDTLTLRKMIDETELKQALVTKLRLEMTAEQLEALSPESVRDHVGIDLFSSGIIWVGRLRRFRHTSRDNLVDRLQNELLATVPESDTAPALAEIQTWVDGLSNEFLEHSADELEKRGWGTLERTLACAKQFLALIDRLFDRGQLPDTVKASMSQNSQGTLMLDRPATE